MRNFLYIILAVTVVGGCTDPKQTEVPANDTTKVENEKAGTGSGVMALGGDSQFDAVVLGTGVRSRQKADVSGEVVRPFTQGELVKIVEVSKERTVISPKNACEEYGYPWVKVRDSKGAESWIFGKYLFKFTQMRSEKGRVNGGQELTIGGQPYMFQLAADMGQGISDENGELSGCNLVYTPVLVKPGQTTGTLFFVNPKKIGDPRLAADSKVFDTNLLILTAESEGTKDQIESVEVHKSEPVITIHLTHEYQDGGEAAKIVARAASERVDVVSYEKQLPL